MTWVKASEGRGDSSALIAHVPAWTLGFTDPAVPHAHPSMIRFEAFQWGSHVRSSNNKCKIERTKKTSFGAMPRASATDAHVSVANWPLSEF